MGQEVLSVQRLTHGYQDRTLFKGCDFEMEKSERVALIGNPVQSGRVFVHMALATILPCSSSCCCWDNLTLKTYSHPMLC